MIVNIGCGEVNRYTGRILLKQERQQNDAYASCNLFSLLTMRQNGSR